MLEMITGAIVMVVGVFIGAGITNMNNKNNDN